MTGKYTKKFFGTFIAISGLVALVLGGATMAQARFIGGGRTIIFDAVVNSVGSNSFEVLTTGTNPITINVTDRTHFSNQQQLDDLEEGDSVKVIARRSGSSLDGVLIRETGNNGGSYGTAGDHVLVARGTVSNKGADTFTVDFNTTEVTFHVSSATKFFGTSFSSLSNGDRVVVIGEDTGESATGFVAKKVFN